MTTVEPDPQPLASGSTRITIGSVLDTLGPDLLHPLALPHGRSVPVGVPVIHSAEESTVGMGGAALLVLGRPTSDLIRRAADAEVSAVIVKTASTEPQPLADAANAAGVALLAAGDVPWGRLYTLVDTLHVMTAPLSHPADSTSSDLFALANDIAVRVGGAVAIEDRAMRVLAYSTIPGQVIDDLRRDGILERRVPENPTHAEEYAAVFRADAAVWSRRPEEFYPRLAVAVRIHGEPLGTIWVVQAGKQLNANAADELVVAARGVAPHLARATLAADDARREISSLLRKLIRGTVSVDRAAAVLGLDVSHGATVVAIGRSVSPSDLSPLHATASDEFAAELTSDLLRTSLGAFRLRSAVGGLDGVAVAIVDVDAAAPVLLRVLRTVLAQAEVRLGAGWRAGISSALPDLAELPLAIHEAQDALRILLGPFARHDIAQYEDLSSALFLSDVHDVMRDRLSLRAAPLAAVSEMDQRQGTEYVKTLSTWIESHYDVPRTADALTMHPNTVRYRLRRIGETVDLDDPDVRLSLAIQLRLSEDRTSRAT